MSDGTTDQLQVAFPASEAFTRIGRVAVVGLALRLGYDVGTVERLRSAVDEAVSALQGPGRISAHASWTPDHLSIALTNPRAEVIDPETVAGRLEDLVDEVEVGPTTIRLTLPASGT